MSIIQKLNSCGLLRELWCYFTIKDISHLFLLSKKIRFITLGINKLVPSKINLRILSFFIKISGFSKLLRNILFCFPNISSLIVSQDDRSLYSLRELFDCVSLFQSLKELEVTASIDLDFIGISKLKNIEFLHISHSKITDDIMFEIGLLTC